MKKKKPLPTIVEEYEELGLVDWEWQAAEGAGGTVVSGALPVETPQAEASEEKRKTTKIILRNMDASCASTADGRFYIES